MRGGQPRLQSGRQRGGQPCRSLGAAGSACRALRSSKYTSLSLGAGSSTTAVLKDFSSFLTEKHVLKGGETAKLQAGRPEEQQLEEPLLLQKTGLEAVCSWTESITDQRCEQEAPSGIQ